MEGRAAATSSLTGFTLILVCVLTGCGGDPPDSEGTPRATASYLGQPLPGETPESFAPGIINTDAIELNGVVSPDGRYLFFSRRTGVSWDDADAGDVYWVDAAVIERMRRSTR